MAVEMKPEFTEQIEKAYYAWFTTVRADGTPQPTPVWFIKDGDHFLIYSIPNTQKLRNISGNAHVSLNVCDDPEGEKFVVVMGTATVDSSIPQVHNNPAYLAKYADGIKGLGWTAEEMGNRFTSAIRVTPVQVRGEG